MNPLSTQTFASPLFRPPVRLSAFLLAVTVLGFGALSLPATEPIDESGDLYAQTVERMFRDDQIADIRVVFGYDNSADTTETTDSIRADHFIAYITQHSFMRVMPTPEIAAELGVPKETANLRVYQGQDVKGRVLRVSLIWSCLSTNVAKNLGSQYKEQLRVSEEALTFMRKAVTDAEMFVYVGHSRGGGGPDTFPPETTDVLDDGKRKVDFSHYRKTRPGLAALGPYMSKSSEKPYFMAWTSCKSDALFYSWISSKVAAKKHPTGLVLSTRVSGYEAWSKDIYGHDEGLMALVAIVQSVRLYPWEAALKEKLHLCEIDSMTKEKALWKVRWVQPKTAVPLTPKVEKLADASPATTAGAQ